MDRYGDNVICNDRCTLEVTGSGVTRSTTSERTIEMVRTGITEQLVSDNGSQFTSEVFEAFAANNGIFHIKFNYPATNGRSGAA